MESFKKLGLSESTIKALKEKGYKEPTEIQEKAIPLLLTGEKDIIGQSQTGTGKTASFALPIIERLKPSNTTKALILTPTRELALQITSEIDSLKGDKNLKVITVYGGASMSEQIRGLERGVDIVVGTPGRVMDLMDRKKLNIQNIEYAVLDEADEMLNMGFVEDIELILKSTPKNKKMLLFSATMPNEIIKIAKKLMREYVTINVQKKEFETELIEQVCYHVNSGDRFEALRRIIDTTEDFHGIIFCKTRMEVNELSTKMMGANYDAGALHGDISQSEREKILAKFKSRKLTVLIATDVAARGIDVNDLTHVINYSLPQSPDLYVHRIGRTGRAGKKGIAITFVMPSEQRKLKFLEKVAKSTLTKKELPSIAQVKEIKEKLMEAKVRQLIEKRTEKFTKLANSLLETNDPVDVVKALLQDSFGNEMDRYKEISKAKAEEGNSRQRRERERQRRFGGRREGSSRDSDQKPRNRERSRENRGGSDRGGSDRRSSEKKRFRR